MIEYKTVQIEGQISGKTINEKHMAQTNVKNYLKFLHLEQAFR